MTCDRHPPSPSPSPCRIRIAFVALLASVAAASPSTSADPVDIVRLAEDAWADARPMEATRAYVEALDAFRALPPEALAESAPEVELAIRRLESGLGATGACAHLADALRPWAESPDAPPEIRALARRLLGWSVVAKTGSIDAGREIWKPLGYLEGWRVIGPFENERGSAFRSAQPPEAGIDLDGAYPGKDREARWRALPVRPVAGVVDLNALFEPDDECLAFALTFVRSDAKRAATLAVSSDESVHAWVNGKLVLARDVRRSLGFDDDRVAIELDEGWNAILLELSESDGEWRFSARLEGADGAPLSGIEEGSPPEDDLAALKDSSVESPQNAPPRARDAEGSALPGGIDPQDSVLATLRSRIEKDAGDARAWYLLGALLRARDAHDEGEHPDTDALKKAVALDPELTIAHLELAQSLRRESRIAAERDDNSWRLALIDAAERGSAAAALTLAEHYVSSFANLTRSEEWMRRALELSPEHPAAILLRGRLEASRGFFRAQERAVSEAERIAPELPSVLLERAAILERHGRNADALAILERLWREDRTSRAARDRLVRLLVDSGRVDDGLAVLEEKLAHHPFDASAHLFAARLALGRDDPSLAREAVERALALAPDDHRIAIEHAETLWAGGDRDGAIASWERAIALQPNLPEVRKRLEFLRTGGARFEDDVRRDVAEIVKDGLSRPLGESDHAAHVLLDLEAVRVLRDGTARELVQQVILVLNDQGVRAYDQIGASYSSGEQVVEFRRARVHRRDGTTADAPVRRFGDSGGGDGWRSARIDLPPLSPGDVIEIEYVREEIEQSFFGDYFGRVVTFQGTVPIDEKVFILRAPADKQLHFHEQRLDLEPEKSVDDDSGAVTWRWSRRDIEALEPEPAMPGFRETVPLLEISTFASWDAFSSWYHHLIRKQFESSPEIRDKVRELVSGISDDLEKIRAIYHFVVTEVRYNAWEFGVHGFKPYNAATVFSRRFGDCKDKATLLTVMLEEVGIKSHPVLIRAEQRRGSEDLTLPMINHFNHCITFVPGDGARPDLFLDGTASFHGLDELPSMDRGAQVLVVKDDAADLRQVPWNSSEGLSLEEEWTVDLSLDGPSRVEVRLAPRGDYAVSVRQSFEVEGQRKTQIENAYGRRFSGARVIAESFSDLGDLSQPVSLLAELEVPRITSPSAAGPSLAIPDDLFRTGESLGGLLGLEERDFDVILGNPRRSRLRVVYRLPEGVTVRSLPEERDIEARFGRFTLRFANEGRELVVERTIEIASPRVSVDDWPALRELISSIERLEEERIVLSRG